MSVSMSPDLDHLARLPALAKRLGVEPRRPGDPPSVLLCTREGVQYDLFDLVGALLDRMERACDEIQA